MPKEYFFNLKPKKVQNVFDGAIEEFSEYSLKSASINRIIERIGISRGSFYNYFEDLEDLYGYIVAQTYKSFFESLITKVHESYGNVGLAFKKHMEDIKNIYNIGEKSLVKNLFLNVEMSTLLSKDHSIAATVGEEEMERFYRSIDRSRYNLTDQEFVDYTDMLFMLLSNFVFEFVRDSRDFDSLYNDFARKVDLLDAGVKA